MLPSTGAAKVGVMAAALAMAGVTDSLSPARQRGGKVPSITKKQFTHRKARRKMARLSRRANRGGGAY